MKCELCDVDAGYVCDYCGFFYCHSHAIANDLECDCYCFPKSGKLKKIEVEEGK